MEPIKIPLGLILGSTFALGLAVVLASLLHDFWREYRASIERQKRFQKRLNERDE